MEKSLETWWSGILLKVQNQENLSRQEVESAWNFLWEEWKKIDSTKLNKKILPKKMRLFLAMRNLDPMVMLIAPAFLVSIFSKGLTGEEMKGFKGSFDRHHWFASFRESTFHLPGLVYTNGFGGDQINTINVSTPAMIIAAAAGAKIIKMGSHSYFGKSGAQNFTDEVGIKALTTAEEVRGLLGKVNSAYIDGAATADSLTRGIADFMSRVPEGKELMKAMFYPFRYMVLCFNFFNAAIQQRGISTLKTEMAADLLLATIKNIRLAHVTAGMDKDGKIMDEVSNVGKTKITTIKNHQRTETFFTTPGDWGVKERKTEEIPGGFAPENTKIILEILKGKRQDAYWDLLAVNASQFLFLSGIVTDFKTGTQLAKETIARGSALEELQKTVKESGGDPDRLGKILEEIK